MTKRLSRVPVREDTSEINLAKLLAVSKQSGQAMLKADDGVMSVEVLVTATKLAVRLAGSVKWLLLHTENGYNAFVPS